MKEKNTVFFFLIAMMQNKKMKAIIASNSIMKD